MKFALVIFSDFFGDEYAIVPDTAWRVSVGQKSIEDLEKEFTEWAVENKVSPDPAVAKTKRSLLFWFDNQFSPRYDDLATLKSWKRCVNSTRVHKESDRVALSLSKNCLEMLEGYMQRHNIKTRTRAIEQLIKKVCND